MPELHRPKAIGVGASRETSDETAPRDSWREDELDLGWYIQAIQQRWKMLAAGALIGAGLALAVATTRPIVYEGVTTLLVVPNSNPSATQVNPATLRAILENAAIASEVIGEIGLQQPPHNFTAQSFLERALLVEEVGTNIVRVKVRLRDAALAADASRRIARKAILLTQKLNDEQGTSVQEQLKRHLNDAGARLKTAAQELLAFQQTAQVELLKEDTQAMLDERGDLLKLLISIESEKARLQTAEQEIKRQERILPVARAVGAEEALRRTDGTSEVLDASHPFINPVYQSLDFQIATSRARLAGLEQERRQLVDVRKLAGGELTELSELYRRQFTLARLQTNFDLANRVHSDLTVRYEQSRTEVLGKSAQLQLVDEAIPPDRPIPRRRVQFLALGFAAGLLGAAFVALVWESRRQRATPA